MIFFILLKIDPTKFKWVNSDNIKPGATTCGFLYTPLGAEPGVNYPIIKVYICVKFAVHQPAPSGNIVTHCGGPGSASDCGIGMGSAYSIGKENADNYNIIGIDQVRNKYQSIFCTRIRICTYYHKPDDMTYCYLIEMYTIL